MSVNTISEKLLHEAAEVGLTLEAIESIISLEVIRRRAKSEVALASDEEKERLYLRQMKRKYSRIVDEW